MFSRAKPGRAAPHSISERGCTKNTFDKSTLPKSSPLSPVNHKNDPLFPTLQCWTHRTPQERLGATNPTPAARIGLDPTNGSQGIWVNGSKGAGNEARQQGSKEAKKQGSKKQARKGWRKEERKEERKEASKDGGESKWHPTKDVFRRRLQFKMVRLSARYRCGHCLSLTVWVSACLP